MLDDLAERAPRFDVSDAALRTAQRRRRRRHVLTATVVLLTAVAIGTLPVAAPGLTGGIQPSGPRGAATTYEADVKTPWFGVDDVPTTLAEPISMVLSNSGSGAPGGDDLVVTASGRVFRLPDSAFWTATVSPDGHVVVFYDVVEHAITSRDLRDGTTYRYPPIHSRDLDQADRERPVVSDGYPSSWSPNGNLVALLADHPTLDARFAIVLDVTNGTDRHFELTDAASAQHVDSIGWKDDDTLLFPRAGAGTTTFPITLLEIRIDGIGEIAAQRAAGSPPGAGQPFVITPDQDALVSTATGFPLIRRFDIATGESEDFECPPCTGALGTQWASAREVVVTADSTTDGYPLVPQAVDIDTGATRPLAAISGRELSRGVVFARDLLLAGPTHDPHTSMWWPGWYLDWITYSACGLLLVVGAVILIRRRRRPTTTPALPRR